MIKFFVSFYLFWLAVAAAGIFLLGVVVAPIVFHSEVVIGVKLLARYEAGLMMSEIFSRFNYILLITAALIVAFEGFLAVNKKNTKLMISLSALNVAGILVYAFVFTPKIISFQALGEEAIRSEAFANIHKMAELDFKILLFALTVAFFVRLSSILEGTFFNSREDK